MRYTLLDKLIRENLLSSRLPLHYYTESMMHASRCLQEMYFDSLKVINTVELTLNPYFAIDLPSDYSTWVSLSEKQGQFLRPITQRQTINPLPNVDQFGNPIPYGDPATKPDTAFSFWGWPGYFILWNVNDLGEPLGRMYGYNSGITDGFIEVPGRNQIQFTERPFFTSVVLQYISDGQSSNAATQVDPYAGMTILSYINWKRSRNANNGKSPEGMLFGNELRKLRARKDDLTVPDLRRVLQKAYQAGVKSA
jgi:hypothetical protein